MFKQKSFKPAGTRPKTSWGLPGVKIKDFPDSQVFFDCAQGREPVERQMTSSW
jgi:hypothetical protein